jgi:hypothetical protein
MSFGTTMYAALLTASAVLLLLWAVKDAMSRRKSALFVAIAVVFFFPSGLIASLLFRPAVAGRLPRSLQSR